MSEAERNFFTELKRRRVFRVIGMYAVASFILLQIGDVAFEPLGLPAGSQRLLIILLAVLFPLVVMLAWIFDITPDGIVKTTAQEAPLTGAPWVNPRLDWTIITLLVAVIVYLIWDPDFGSQSQESNKAVAGRTLEVTAQDTVQKNSIAVLKFSSLSPDPADAYFADGMAAEIQSVLARIPDLRTVAISASQRLRDSPLDEQALGERLGVSYLLDGSVRKAGDDIRITVQLVRAVDGQQVWSETYQRKVDDVFAIQDLIAEMVARRLKSTLYREGISAIARDRTDNFEAYNHYLTAVYYAPTGRWDLVADYARRATVADPTFQSAHALLARAYLTRLGGRIPAAQAYPTARGAVETALSLNPDDPEALLLLGRLERAAGNYRAAESVYRNVKAIAPNLISTDLANLLQMLGRLDEALIEYERSRLLDPFAGGTFYEMALVAAGRTDEAVAQLNKELLLAQNSDQEIFLRCTRALILAQTGDIAAIEPLDELIKAVPQDEYTSRGYLAYSLSKAGRLPEAERIVADLENRARTNYVSPTAMFYATLGLADRDRIFFWLDQAINEKVFLVTVLLRTSPIVNSIRNDPRFEAALDRVGLLRDV